MDRTSWEIAQAWRMIMGADIYRKLLAPATVTAAAYPPPGAWIPRTLPGSILFHRGYPFAEAIPALELAQCAQELIAEEGDLPLHYSGSPSTSALARLIGERSKLQGLMIPGDRVLVTSGACQAISLVTTAFLSPSDTVAVEGPSYMESLEIFRNKTPNIIAYPVDEDGLITDLVAADLAERRQNGRPLPKLLYTIPTNHNPTGTTLTLKRRRHLLALAAEYDFLILEDGAYAELSWTPPPPAIKALDRAGRVIYLGSYSKIVAPGLRIGWALGPDPVIKFMDLFKRDNDPVFAQAVAARYLIKHDLDVRVAWLTEQYRARCAYLSHLLHLHLPPGCTWIEPKGGYFIWVALPPSVDALELAKAGLQEKVSVVADVHFLPPLLAVQGRRHVRFSFSYLSLSEMEEGVVRFARVLAQQSGPTG